MSTGILRSASAPARAARGVEARRHERTWRCWRRLDMGPFLIDEPPGSGKLSHPGSPRMSPAGSPMLSHPGGAIGTDLTGRDQIPSSFSPPLEILDRAHQLREVTSGGTEESGDRHP